MVLRDALLIICGSEYKWADGETYTSLCATQSLHLGMGLLDKVMSRRLCLWDLATWSSVLVSV